MILNLSTKLSTNLKIYSCHTRPFVNKILRLSTYSFICQQSMCILFNAYRQILIVTFMFYIKFSINLIRKNDFYLLMTLESQQKPISLSLEKWRSVTARIKESEIPLLMNRLKECGCGNVNQLLKEFLTRRIDQMTEDQQVKRMMQTNESSIGLKSILSGNYRYEFYKEIDEEDF